MSENPDAVARKFAANLRETRRQAEISQERLGLGAELHRTEVGMLERGARLPRIDTLVKLAGALEVDAGALLDGIAWRPGANRLGEFLANSPQAGPITRSGCSG